MAIGVLTTITVSVGVSMLGDLEFTVLVIVVITLDFSVPLSYVADAWPATFIDVGVLLDARVDFVVDVMADALGRVFAGAIITAVTDVDLLGDVNVNVVSGVMTALGVSISASL